MAAIAYDPENVFQKILDGAIPSFKIFETEHVLAILDAFPLVPGHALLIPKALYATVLGACGRALRAHPALVTECVYARGGRGEPVQGAAALGEGRATGRKQITATGADGINIIQNNGAASGQAVFHAHIHVVPRFNDDGVLKLPAGQKMIEKEDGLAWLAKIQGKL